MRNKNWNWEENWKYLACSGVFLTIFEVLENANTVLSDVKYTWSNSYVNYELNKLTSLPMCGFIAQLVEHWSHRYRGGHGFESRWSPAFFLASSFQLLKLENLLRWSFFTFTVLSIWYTFSIETKTKKKIVKIYANKEQISKHSHGLTSGFICSNLMNS